MTGRNYTRGVRFRLDQGRRTIFSEPMGSRRLEDQMSLDLRLEKTFRIAERFRFGLMMDVFNVFNDDSITSWGSTINSSWFPDLSQYASSEGHKVYGLVSPRAIRIGMRLFF
jgi:hypothetical protein